MESVNQHINVTKLEMEMQARPDLRKSLEEFRKKPFALRRKEAKKSFDEHLQEEIKKQ